MNGGISSAGRALLDVEGLSAGYDERNVLRGVSLSVRAGEFVALTGPNGSGKTTLLRSALGLLEPRQGRILLDGERLASLSVGARARRVAWVPQDEAPQENVPIFDYVLYGRHPYLPRFGGENEEDRERTRAALREVGLESHAESGVLEVSGGERQRVLLARAMVQGCPLLLLDEPTAHLDIAHQLELLDRVRGLCRQGGRGALAAMHDLNLAARFADRIVVLSRGRLVADGRPSEVLSESLLREVWGVLGDLRRDGRTGVPFLVPRLPALEEAPAPGARLGPGPVHVVGGGGAASAVLRALFEAGYRVTAGALHLLDSDSETALELGIPVAAEVPFAALGEEVRDRHRLLLKNAAAFILAPFPVGPSNLANLEDLLPFAGTRPMYLLGGPVTRDRDFAGGRAVQVGEQLLTAGAVAVDDVPRLLERLGRDLAG